MFKMRNPANTFTLTQVNPVITADYNTELESAFSYVIYKTGTTIKRMNMVTRAIESSGTVADVQIQAAIDALGNDSGKAIFIKDGLYTLTATLNFTAINGNCHIIGNGYTGTQLRPSGDFPAFTITGKTNIVMNNLWFTHNQPAYTSSLIRLENVSNSTFRDIDFYDFGHRVGNCVGLDCTTGPVVANTFYNCKMLQFNNSIFANLPNSTHYINGNNFFGCKLWSPKQGLKVTSVASAQFDSNNFFGCIGQTYSGTTVGFDYDSTGRALYSTHVGCIFFDLGLGNSGAGANYANVNNLTDINFIGTIPDWLVGGSGASSGKFLRNSSASIRQGEGSFSGNGSTTAFVVTHGMSATPTHVVIEPSTSDAQGFNYISARSSTTFTVTYGVAPPTGSSNVKFYWRASIT